MINRQYTAEQIRDMDFKTLQELPMGGLYITFMSGETLRLKTTWVADSWYCLQFSKRYPGMVIEPAHFFQKDEFTSDDYNEIGSLVFWDSMFARIEKHGEDIIKKEFWEATEFLYQVLNRVYNDTNVYQAKYAHTLDYSDFSQIICDPRIMELKELWKRGEIAIDDAHFETMRIITGCETMSDNNIRASVKSDILSKKQLCQMIMRGVIMDINGETFNTPIWDGYADGLNDPYFRAIESRNASLSIYMSEAPLEASEYYNRQAQQHCSVIGEVAEEPCSGKYALDWRVTKRNLPWLVGSNHMVDGVPVMITRKDTHLIGKTIKLRNLTRCDNHDPARPCPVCLGYFAWAIPPKSSVGHQLTIDPLTKFSQKLLGIKHVIASIKTKKINLNGNNGTYLTLDRENKHRIMLKPLKNPEQWILRVKAADMMYINDIYSVDSVSDIIPSTVSALTKVELMMVDSEGQVKKPIGLDLSIGDSGSPLSKEMLAMLHTYGWEIGDKGTHFDISLAHWDFDKPIAISPRRSESMMTILNNIRDYTVSHQAQGGYNITKTDSITEALTDFMELVYDDTGINLVHASVFIRASMCVDNGIDDRDFALPRPDEPFRFVGLKECLLNRSAGLMLGYQEQFSVIKSPSTYLRNGRRIPGGGLDGLWG